MSPAARGLRYARPVALTATIYNFDVDLADQDRHRYDTLAVRMARHPSESEDYLVARLLAYCLEYTDGIVFSNGLSDPDEPAVSVRDLTGAIRVWVDIGSPDASRLHRAAKVADRVVVYTHKDPAQWLRQISGERIHRASDLEIVSFDRGLVASLVERLARRTAMTISVADRHLLVALDGAVLEGDLIRHPLA
jgi:uncharacterized protein YaeQ